MRLFFAFNIVAHAVESSNKLSLTACEGQCNDMHATCTITNEEESGFACNCLMGYSWSENSGRCEDIDECLDGGIGHDTCNLGGGMAYLCQNLIGSFTCVCNSGYYFDPNTNECHDINECKNGTSGCEINCINLEGSFECTSFIPDCHMDFTTSPPSIICTCLDGYTWDRATETCIDVDECAIGADSCYTEPICENTIGSFHCGCNAGMTQGKISTI